MRGILPDNDLTGQFRLIIQMLEADAWRELWISLGLKVESFTSLSLNRDVSDQVLWHICQEKQLVLITGNRNSDDPDSLEATIRIYNRLDCLPVITLADTTKFLQEKSYAKRVVNRLMNVLFDIEKYRGSGRIYIP